MKKNEHGRFNLPTRHQFIPDDDRMEVDHYRPMQRCFKCHKIGHKSKDCRSKAQVNTVVNANRPSDIDVERDMLC